MEDTAAAAALIAIQGHRCDNTGSSVGTIHSSC